MIVPMLRTPVWTARHQLRDAVVGRTTVVVPVALQDGVEVPEPYASFEQNGKLARLHRPPGSEEPDLTRISAVMTIEQELENGLVVPRVVVVHNPFAALPTSDRVFDPFPQWITRGEEMYWIPPRPPG